MHMVQNFHDEAPGSRRTVHPLYLPSVHLPAYDEESFSRYEVALRNSLLIALCDRSVGSPTDGTIHYL